MGDWEIACDITAALQNALAARRRASRSSEGRSSPPVIDMAGLHGMIVKRRWPPIDIAVAVWLMVNITLLTPGHSSLAEAGSDQPTLTLTPDHVSCATQAEILGTGFMAGSEVVIAPAGSPTGWSTWFIGPVTVAADGTFRYTLKPGVFIYACTGGPLGHGETPFVLSASTVSGSEPSETPFGEPSATATFTFAAAPDDPDLTLTPNPGTCESEVVARGTNFVPTTTITIFAKPLIGNAVTNHGTSRVAADGTFTLPLEHSFACGSSDGTKYLVTATTGGGMKIDDGPDVSASEVFTVGAEATDFFARTWSRADQPVQNGRVARTWMWGPRAIETRSEPYQESPSRSRTVQYFDKSRMEINNPEANDDGLWYVTNGLLVAEMIEGHYQIGDALFDESPEPADIPIAGDPDSGSPTYADINRFNLMDAEPAPIEHDVVTEQLTADGSITRDKALARYGVSSGPLVPETDHRVASVFWDFMTSEGLIYDVSSGQYVTDDLFQNPFYATGYPITEAYWTTAELQGEPTDILWQCFERRCLTYTPSNAEGFQVEAGNVGQHYFRWRYDEAAAPGS